MEHWDETKEVNKPKLLPGMVGIYWDSNQNEVEVTEGNKSNWYDYTNQRWANAKTSDGSYWVWIPRYAYKIESGCNNSSAGAISIKFLQDATDIDILGVTISRQYPTVISGTMEDYVIHPSFTNGTSNNFKNGEWNEELTGYWVSKYEMAREDSSNGGTSWSQTTIDGNVTTVDTGTNRIRTVSKPGLHSWTSISMGNSYINSYNYDRNNESHMIKNSEWGAVAYLTHSSYGRNRVEITRNDELYTGGAEGATANTNISQSSTGNNTGIFDLAGGAYDRTAGYISNGVSSLDYGSIFANTTVQTAGYQTLSTKYATVYPYANSYTNGLTFCGTEDESATNYNAYKGLKSTTYGFGDAILETSSSGIENTSWNGDNSSFPESLASFFNRGGDYNITNTITGIFNFNLDEGTSIISNSFRTVLVGGTEVF